MDEAYAGGLAHRVHPQSPGERQAFVERTGRGRPLEDRAACLRPAVFGGIGVPRERIFRLNDEVMVLRAVSKANLAAKGRERPCRYCF